MSKQSSSVLVLSQFNFIQMHILTWHVHMKEGTLGILEALLTKDLRDCKV